MLASLALCILMGMGNDTALVWPVVDPHCITVQVAADDTDAFEHTNNVCYLRWLEDCAWSHTCALGLDMAAYRRIGAGCVARRHELDYLAPSFAGETLVVATWIEENDGRVTMWRGYQVMRPADGRVILRARTQWACVDMVTGRPRRQPEAFVEAYRAASPVAAAT